MNRNPDEQIAARDKLIAGLEKENKIQDMLIKEQKRMIQTLESHISELQKMLEQLLKL